MIVGALRHSGTAHRSGCPHTVDEEVQRSRIIPKRRNSPRAERVDEEGDLETERSLLFGG
jgi:hypothetical protein